MRDRRLARWAVLLWAAGAGCSSPSSPNVSGESHWLLACRDDSGCGDESLSCVCGTCTRACSTDASCKGGACYDTDSPLLLQRCEARKLAGAGVCLAQCKVDRDCGAGRSCSEGACVASPYADIDASVSWSEPVRELPMELTISGEVDDKLGTWRDIDCDPTRSSFCVSLTLESDAAGAARGFVEFASDHPVYGPFAPAVDPNLGYPREVVAGRYGDLFANNLPNVHYRLANARLVGDELSFEWNGYELWRDWCAMQTPYAWQFGERTLYFCVPQDQGQWAELDLGKLALCRSAEFTDLCTDESGRRLPCACVDPSDPLCSTNLCKCTAEGCGLPPPNRRWALRFDAPKEVPLGDADQETAWLSMPDEPQIGVVPMLRLGRVTP